MLDSFDHSRDHIYPIINRLICYSFNHTTCSCTPLPLSYLSSIGNTPIVATSTRYPSTILTSSPSNNPTITPSDYPSTTPTSYPSGIPSRSPSQAPVITAPP
eukprot:1092326_1